MDVCVCVCVWGGGGGGYRLQVYATGVWERTVWTSEYRPHRLTKDLRKSVSRRTLIAV